MNSTSKRLHFGVMVSSIEEACQSVLWKGIEAFASEHNIDITAYLSIFQQKTGRLEEHYQVVFDAAEENMAIDGLILFGGFIAEDITTAELDKYLDKFPDMPMVSIAMSYPGKSSLLVDNERGTFKVVRHMIKEHGCTKVVFVKGPEDHEEAEARYMGYKNALKTSGIPLDENLVVQGGGNFSTEDGEEAVQKLLAREGLTFDAIVAADDDTAVGVLQELNKRGIKVPTDVLVGGFDDAEVASIITPTLTTVKQPFYDLGYKASETLKQVIEGKEVDPLIFLSPKLICRQSCGCIDLPEEKFNIEDIEKGDESFSSYLLHVMEQEFDSTVYKTLPVNLWIEGMAQEILASPFNPLRFLKLFDEILIRSQLSGANLQVWREVLTAIINGVNLFNDEISTCFSEISQAVYRATWLINSIQSRSERQRVMDHSDTQWEIRGISQEIVTSFNFKDLTKKLIMVQEELDIENISIYQYENSIQYDSWKKPQKLVRLLTLNSSGVSLSDRKDSVVELAHIGQNHFKLDTRKTMLMMPLFFGKEQLGVLFLEYNDELPIDTYESLRISIATALKGASLIQEVKNISITDELTGLYNRRGFLTLSYSRLARLRRAGTSGALFFIDLDGLKQINDTMGHKMGDVAITAAANILKSSVRDEDIIGRMGGDEFTIFASQVSEEGRNRIIDRIREKFLAYNDDNDQPFLLSCSIGAAPIYEFTEETFNEVLSHADSLLYEEKNEKRKRGLGRQ